MCKSEAWLWLTQLFLKVGCSVLGLRLYIQSILNIMLNLQKGNQPYCIIISDNQPYCIICNCPFSHYGLHIVSLIYFQHISFFSVWSSGTELGGALYILFPSVFVFFPGLLGWFPVFAGPLHLVPGLLHGRPVRCTQDPPVYRPGESHPGSWISWERGGCL